MDDGAAHGNRVEPAAAASPACHRSEFVTHSRQVLAELIEQLRRKRSRADARGISFDDAEHLMQPAWPQSRAGSCSAGRGG